MTGSQERSLLPRHVPTLDLFRGSAILLVLVFHAFGSFDWNPIFGPFLDRVMNAIIEQCNYGVQLFFMLSGFLITNGLLRSRERSDYYGTFYIKRALRILPLFAVILIVLKIFLPISWNFFIASCFFLANFAPLFGAHSSEFGPLWSLCVEEHFYLFWPTFVRRLNPGKLAPILASILVIEPVLRVVVINHNANIDIRFKTPFLLDYLAYGAIISVLIHRGKLTRENVHTYGVAIFSIGASLVLVTLGLASFRASLTLEALRAVPWIWMCVGLLLLGLERDRNAEQRTESNAVKTSGFLGFFAYVSYGLYLIHPIVNEKLGPHVFPYLMAHGFHGLNLAIVNFLILSAVAVSIAYLSRRFFEDKALELKDRLIARRSAPIVEVVELPHAEVHKEEVLGV